MFPARTEIHPSLQHSSVPSALLHSSSVQRIPASTPRPLYGVTDQAGMPTSTPARLPRQFPPYHQSSSPESEPSSGEPSHTAPPVVKAAEDVSQKVPTQGGPGKEKPRAYIACQTCRSRKVRCNGVKPICTNCEKRNAVCTYDIVPRRRGPDKVPGTRQRGVKGNSVAKKRKRTEDEELSPSKDGPSNLQSELSADRDDLPPYGYPVVPSQPDLVPPPNKRQVTARSTPPQVVPSTAPVPAPIIVPSTLPPVNFTVQSLDSSVVPRKRSISTRQRIALSDLLSPVPVHRPDSYPSSSSVPLGTGTVPSSLEAAYHAEGVAVVPSYTLDRNPSSSSPGSSQFPVTPEVTHQIFDETTNTWHVLPHGSRSSSIAPYPPSFAYGTSVYEPAHIDPVEGEDQDDDLAIYGTYIEKPHSSSIVHEPSLRFSQATWWDSVLTLYEPTARGKAAHAVQTDLQNLFKMSSSWFSFFNVPLFFSLFCHPEHRMTMQPSLVLGCLAYSSLMLGSEAEGGALQRRKSTQLRDLAQAAFEASYNAGWIDVPLAQAAWVMALYEVSAHPDTSGGRMTGSLVLLDNVIRVLGLTFIDADNPRSPIFLENAVPALGRCVPEAGTDAPSHHPLRLAHQQNLQNQPQIAYHATTKPTPFDNYRDVAHYPPVSASAGCPCRALSLGSTASPSVRTSTPLWMATPMWDGYDLDRDYGEIRREESRRLVWSTLTLIAGDRAARLALEQPQLDLHVAKPKNYALLYPGETLYASRPDIDSAFSAKESTWALYARTMLLWLSCTNIWESNLPSHNKSDFAMRTWMETIAIEDALNEHSCEGEKATMYQAREYINITRIFISSGFRRFIPVPQSGTDFSSVDRGKAMQWLAHQNDVSLQLQTVLNSDPHGMPARLLLRRPYLVWWQMNQIHRALILWTLDPSLTFAVDVALNMLPIVRFFTAMWPCAEQKRRLKRMMGRFQRVCDITGRIIPPPPTFEAFQKRNIA